MSQENYYIQVEEERRESAKPRVFIVSACVLLSVVTVVYGISWTHNQSSFEQPMTSTDDPMATSLLGTLQIPRVGRPVPVVQRPQLVYGPANAMAHLGASFVRGPSPIHAVKQMDMPALSSTMTEGKVVEWLKQPGDAISKGDALVVIESDKADMEVESFYDGFLGGITVEDGGSAPVGQPIAFIAEEESEIDEAKAKASSGAGAAAAPPAAAPAPAAAPPSPAPAPAAPPPAPAPAVAAAPAPVWNSGRIVATPAAKTLAAQRKIDLATVKATGPYGRITLEDVEAAAGIVKPAPAPPPAAAAATGAAPATPPSPEAMALRGQTTPFNAMQKAVSNNMVATLAVPEFRVAYTVRMDAFEALYKKLKPKGVTLTAMIGKACGMALAKVPIVNAAYSDVGPGIHYNENVNVAVAVAMPDGGLITPVLKNADATDIYQLSREWGDLVKRARGKALKPDEYNSGTFTVSNLGMFGVDQFGALLPVGSGGILAVGGTKSVVAADKAGKIGIERQMQLTLTADHRIIYGADSAEFLKTLAEIMENPDQIL